MKEKITLTVAVFCAFGVARLPPQEDMLLRAFSRSVRNAYHGDVVRLVLLTDAFLDSAVYRGVFDDIFQHEVVREELLLSRAQAYLSVIKRFGSLSALALQDYDTLVRQRFADVFLSGHDIYVTGRKYAPSMPVNGGVILLNSHLSERCTRFYDSVVNTYRRLPKNTLQWWGDQIALSTVVLQGSRIDTNLPSEVVALGDVRVRFLQRERFNFTPYDVDSGQPVPPNLDDSIKDLLRVSVVIVHFKGPRKHLMLEWAEAIGGTLLS